LSAGQERSGKYFTSNMPTIQYNTIQIQIQTCLDISIIIYFVCYMTDRLCGYIWIFSSKYPGFTFPDSGELDTLQPVRIPLLFVEIIVVIRTD
jgi:hypothetical protein